MDKFDESSNNKKNSKKSRINDEDSKKNNQNTNDNVYEFLKEENKKVLFDKLINNFSESFLVEQKLTTSRQSKIPYFKFNDKTIPINEDYNNIKELKKENKEYEIIKVGETKEIILGNDIIYGLTLISHYVVAVSKEYMKMYDLKDSNYKEVKSIFIKDVFFYCVDATKLDNIYYIVMGGNANSIFVYTINVENNNNDNNDNNMENNNNKSEINENIEELIGHKNDINDLKFLIKHPNILLSASSDSTVRVWDIKKKN
jgi:WD40 repeat protein